MLELWKSHELEIVDVKDEKLFFAADEHGTLEVENIDLVKKYEVGEKENIFLYLDSDKKVRGCMGQPFVAVGEFGSLTCVANTKIGAFLDWGIEKDLFCPFKEQKTDMKVDQSYIVYVYIDEATNRAVASTKYTKFIDEKNRPQVEEQQKVTALVTRRTALGYNLIVENKYSGILYENEVFSDLHSGDVINVIVKKIRDDNKIDLRMFKNDANDIHKFENQILTYLRKHNGVMHICDNSDPEVIYKAFGISKKNFKKALGALYRKELVDIVYNGVKLIEKE